MQTIAIGFLTVVLIWMAACVPAWSGTFQEGLDLVGRDQFFLAAQAFTLAIERGESPLAAYSNRCLVQLKLGNYSDAISDCSEAIETASPSPEAYLNRGLAHHYMQHYDDAVADYDRLLSLNRQDFRGYYNRGLSHMAMEGYDSAIDDFKISERLSRQENPLTRAHIFNDWGLALFLQERWMDAFAKFNRSIDLSPTVASYYYNRGCTCDRLDELDCALNDFSQTIALDDQFADAYVSRGMIDIKLGEVRAALRNWLMAADLFEGQHNFDAQQYIQGLIERVTVDTSKYT